MVDELFSSFRKWTECSHSKLFNCIKTVHSTNPISAKQIIAFTYLFEHSMYSVKGGTKAFLSSTIKISANTRPNGQPIATSSDCKKRFPKYFESKM